MSYESKSRSLRQTPKGYSLVLGVALPSYAYSLPWRVGLATASASDHPVGVLYIVNFVFFAGASGGALIVGALARALHPDGVRAESQLRSERVFANERGGHLDITNFRERS